MAAIWAAGAGVRRCARLWGSADGHTICALSGQLGLTAQGYRVEVGPSFDLVGVSGLQKSSFPVGELPRGQNQRALHSPGLRVSARPSLESAVGPASKSFRAARTRGLCTAQV
eukprot:360076-Chlamydomonas_euryale.AAC.1